MGKGKIARGVEGKSEVVKGKGKSVEKKAKVVEGKSEGVKGKCEGVKEKGKGVNGKGSKDKQVKKCKGAKAQGTQWIDEQGNKRYESVSLADRYPRERKAPRTAHEKWASDSE